MKRVFPLAFLSILALFAGACGGGSKAAAPASTLVRGAGFRFSAPAGWTRFAGPSGLGARHGSGVVLVQTFRLRKPYDPAEFPAAAKVMDRIVAQLAAKSKGSPPAGETITIAGRKARAYPLTGGRRIGFVLVGRREYQLYCSSAASGACSLLFDSFATVG